MAQELTYDLLKQLERDGLLKKLLGKGLVSIHYLNGKEMYEAYLEYREQGKDKMEAYCLTANDFDCSQRTVERTVIKMES